MTEKQEIENIIKKAQKLSIYALKELCNELNLDSNIVLQELPSIRFGKLRTGVVGEYATEPNEIILKDKLLVIMSRVLKAEKKDKDKLIIQIAETIVHETIHSLRVITRKEDQIDDIYLAKTIIDLDTNSSYDEDREERERVACYILQDESKEELEETIFSKKGYDIDKKIDELQNKINLQEGLEECITEALAQISINHLLKKKSFRDTVDDILDNPKMKIDTIIGARIIKVLDDETIKWFLSTKANPEYEDIFKIVFKDEYTTLLEVVNDAYRDKAYIDKDEAIKNSLISKIEAVLESTKQNKKLFLKGKIQ